MTTENDAEPNERAAEPVSLPVDLPTLLTAALAQAGGNRAEAARMLGMGRTTLVEKLRRRAGEVGR